MPICPTFSDAPLALRGSTSRHTSSPERARLGSLKQPLVWQSITTGSRADGPLRDYVIFPSVATLLTVPGLAKAGSCALLRLQDDTVWMLRAVGHGWTPGRLEKTATIIYDAKEAGEGEKEIERILGRALSMPSVRLLNPVLDRASPAQWDIPGIGLALRQLSDSRRSGPNAIRVNIVLQEALDSAVRKFATRMAPDAFIAASASGTFKSWTYSYLIDSRCSTYRRQLVTTLPTLVDVIAAARSGTQEAELRDAVDRGQPLVRKISELFEVRRAVVRHLVGKPFSIVGSRWQSDVRGLARILNVLPLEHLPGSDPVEWVGFNKAVAHAERVSGKLVSDCPAAVCWLRGIARIGWQRGERDTYLRQFAPSFVAAVDRIRDALAEAFQLELQTRRGAGPEVALTKELHVVEQFLITKMAPLKLLDAAESFSKSFAQEIAAGAAETELLLGKTFWPLVPNPFLSSDGARRIMALTSRGSFKAHADALEICLARNDLYVDRCLTGKHFIVAVLDAATGTPCSTVDLKLERNVAMHCWDFRVVQHTAYRNSRPSSACQRAVAELLACCRGEEYQRHVGKGVQVVQRREQEGYAALRREADLLPLSKALRKTMGAEIYESLLDRVMGALSR